MRPRSRSLSLPGPSFVQSHSFEPKEMWLTSKSIYCSPPWTDPRNDDCYRCTGFSSEIGTKLRDWGVGQLLLSGSIVLKWLKYAVCMRRRLWLPSSMLYFWQAAKRGQVPKVTTFGARKEGNPKKAMRGWRRRKGGERVESGSRGCMAMACPSDRYIRQIRYSNLYWATDNSSGQWEFTNV